MDYIEHDLRSLMDDLLGSQGTPFTVSEVKTLMQQLFSAVGCMHEHWLLHRDLKSTNLLLSNDGQIKVADFGLARRLASPPLGKLTPLVQTLWYRAPELLLGATEYTRAIDCWSLGCIMAELLTGRPLLQGRTELDQLDRIFKLLGPPSLLTWPSLATLPHYQNIRLTGPSTPQLDLPMLSPLGIDLLGRLLTYDPAKRLTCQQALEHEWFREAPALKPPSLFPSWPARKKPARK